MRADDLSTAFVPIGLLVLVFLLYCTGLGMKTYFEEVIKKKPEPEDQFEKRIRELVELRVKYNRNIKAHPEEADLLTELFEQERIRIAEREPVEEKGRE